MKKQMTVLLLGVALGCSNSGDGVSTTPPGTPAAETVATSPEYVVVSTDSISDNADLVRFSCPTMT